MEIVAVTNEREIELFHKTLDTVYNADKAYIYPLESDVEHVFNPKKNPSFKRGKAQRFVLLANGKPIGRIAAFYDLNKTEAMEHPIGGVGFFECIDNKEASQLLLDTAKDWLSTEGMMGFDGPINFGERDKFWGLLVESTSASAYLENYNPTYYRSFFEDYGCKMYIEQLTYSIGYKEFDAKRFTKVAEWILRKPGFSFEPFDKKKADKYAHDFVSVYNAAWANFKNFEPITHEKVLKNLEAMRHILVEEFIWFGYVHGKPAGILVMIPDINAILKKLKGKLDLLGKLKFLLYKKTTQLNRVKGLVFGVAPEFQKYGVETVLIYKFYRSMLQQPQYNEVELAWVGAFNSRMQQVMQNMRARVSKVHYTYRKLFDESIPFAPYSIREKD